MSSGLNCLGVLMMVRWALETFHEPIQRGEKITVDEYYQYLFEKGSWFTRRRLKRSTDALGYMRRAWCFLIEEATYEKHKSEGWPTPSGKQEFYSETMIEFGYPEHSIPHYRQKSHVHPDNLSVKMNIAFFQISDCHSTIHSRSANAKWLVEIAHRKPNLDSPQGCEGNSAWPKVTY